MRFKQGSGREPPRTYRPSDRGEQPPAPVTAAPEHQGPAVCPALADHPFAPAFHGHYFFTPGPDSPRAETKKPETCPLNDQKSTMRSYPDRPRSQVPSAPVLSPLSACPGQTVTKAGSLAASPACPELRGGMRHLGTLPRLLFPPPPWLGFLLLSQWGRGRSGAREQLGAQSTPDRAGSPC